MRCKEVKKAEFNEFFKNFLKGTKKGMMLPPTNAEKAMIVGKMKETKKPKKVILPEVVGKMKKK